MTTPSKGRQCPEQEIDLEALKRAVDKAKEIADANPKKYRWVK